MDCLNGDTLTVIQFLKIIHEKVRLFVSVRSFQSFREQTNVMKKRRSFYALQSERY
jgi:hypothetical protein